MEAPDNRRSKFYTATYLVTLIFFLGIHFARAESEMRSGTTLIVSSGKTVTEYGSTTIQSGGGINNQGTIVIKENLVNENDAATNLGPGLFEFSGTAAQTISGQNTFENLTVNNSAGLTILADQRVNGALTLSAGHITLGTLNDKNLLLGPAASVAGAPSASAMIVATGTGEVRKEFANTGSFTYPVGDNTVTAEYSPVTLTFASGSFPSGNFVGVKLEDAAVTDPGILAGTHITRNWSLNNYPVFPITGFTCTGFFTYMPADVVLNGGSESDLFLLKVSPLVSYNAANTTNHILSGTMNSFSNFTGGKAGLTANFKSFLEGPFNGATMNTSLSQLPLGLGTDATKFPNSQPYNIPPWNYLGTESITSIPTGAVDWVLIELRQASSVAAATSSTTIARCAGILLSDGTIVDVAGGPVRFYNAAVSSNLFPVISHRNHLSIIANHTVLKTDGIYTYDYTGVNQIYNTGTNGLKELSPGIWGMVSGNADGDRVIQNSDFIIWQNESGLPTGYYASDFDFSKICQNSDFIIWSSNSGSASSIPQP